MPRGRALFRKKGDKKIANYGLFGDSEAPAADPNTCCGSFTSSGRDLPARVDLRKHCTEVEDQSQSNSCAANAAAGAYEYLIKKDADAKGEEAGDVSRLFIYFIGRRLDLENQGETKKKVKDEGMTLGGAVDAMAMKGACRAELWPFELDNVNDKPPEDAFRDAMNYKVAESMSVPVDVDEMKKALADGYPIITGLKLTQRFFNPGPTGQIRTPDPDDPQSAAHGLHAMLIVGYSDHNQCFIYRNSWGTDWGDQGYCYVPYDYGGNSEYNFCGQYVIRGLTETDLTPDDDEVPDDEDDLFEDHEHDEYDEDEDWEDEEEEFEDEEDDEDYEDLFSEDKDLERVFDMHCDGEDGMGTWELMPAFWQMGLAMPPQQIKRIRRKYDSDESGKIDCEEWKKCYFNVQSQRILMAESQSYGGVTEAFETWDENGDGEISKDELCSVLQELNPNITEEQVDQMLEVADANKDGTVDYEEFIAWLYNKDVGEEEEEQAGPPNRRRAIMMRRRMMMRGGM